MSTFLISPRLENEIRRFQTAISTAQKECATVKEELAAAQNVSESVDSVFSLSFLSLFHLDFFCLLEQNFEIENPAGSRGSSSCTRRDGRSKCSSTVCECEFGRRAATLMYSMFLLYFCIIH